MGVFYYLFHPHELRAIIQWKVWHEPVHTRTPATEPPTLQSCFKYLDLTSRSFSAVIQELNPELLVPVTLFYLVLRGLDTIEDDMTLDIKTKEPLLRSFDTKMEIDGWTFDQSGPNEKDRELLVHFDDVIVELKKLQPKYYDIIKAAAIKMGNGMADYAVKAENNEGAVETIKDYELYCHYVAGLVGEGLTQLFLESQLANPRLGDKPALTESMAQFLQKTNVIRDIHEDWLDKRQWWPKEIWGQYVEKFDDLFKEENRTVAVHCSSAMVLNALKHAEECLFYMAGIRDQSVFNFVAIPQSMAIATLELVFQNPDIFSKHIKISKGDACALMIESTQSLLTVAQVFRKYARRIQKKNRPSDPNFTAISLQCAKLEQFIDTLYPRQDPKRMNRDAQLKEEGQPTMDAGEAFMLGGVAILAVLFMAGLMIGTAWVFGAKFDKLWKTDGPFWPGYEADGLLGARRQEVAHEEL